jgi:hypothetical protein
MTQTEIDKWENKDIRTARMSSIKTSVNLLDIAERMGLLNDIKSLNDLFTEFNGLRNRIFDMIYENQNMHEDLQKHTVDAKTQKERVDIDKQNKCTQKQAKAVWAIIYGENGDRVLENELPEGFNEKNLWDLPYDWATEFIEKYGKVGKAEKT